MSKLTVQLSDEMNEMIEELAEMRGIPKTQLLRSAVKLMKYLDDAIAGGSRLELVSDDGTRARVVLESEVLAVISRAGPR